MGEGNTPTSPPPAHWHADNAGNCTNQLRAQCTTHSPRFPRFSHASSGIFYVRFYFSTFLLNLFFVFRFFFFLPTIFQSIPTKNFIINAAAHVMARILIGMAPIALTPSPPSGHSATKQRPPKATHATENKQKRQGAQGGQATGASYCLRCGLAVKIIVIVVVVFAVIVFLC